MLSSVAVSVVFATAASIYCTVDVAHVFGSKEIWTCGVIHSALLGTYSHWRIVCESAMHCHSGVGATICFALLGDDFQPCNSQ